MDIHEQRGNAIKILARVFWKASKTYEFSLFDIKGGDKHNAIPREAYAKIVIERKNKSGFITVIKTEEKAIYDEIKPIDPNLKVDVSTTDSSKNTLEKTSQEKLLNLLHGLPHGVHQMNYDIKTLVNPSTNLATIAVKENSIVIGMSSRSPMKSALQDMRDRINAIASLSGAKVTEGTPRPP